MAGGAGGGVGGGDVELVPGEGTYADFFIAACWRICRSQHPAW